MRPSPLLLASTKVAALLPSSVILLGGCCRRALPLVPPPSSSSHHQPMGGRNHRYRQRMITLGGPPPTERWSGPPLGMLPALFSSAAPPAVVIEKEDDVMHIDDDDAYDDDDECTMDEDEIACIADMLVGHPPALRMPSGGGGGMVDAMISAPTTTTTTTTSSSYAHDQILGNRSSTSGGDNDIQRRQLDDDGGLLGRRAKDMQQRQLDDELGRAFARRLLELEVYRRENGDCLVPKRYHRNPSLGNWVNKQRQNYGKFMRGEKTSMNETRIAALNERGFVWDATSLPHKSSHVDNNWLQMYHRLAEYRATNGHCRVPSSCPLLGQWVVRQRFRYRRSPPPPSPSVSDEETTGGGESSTSSSSSSSLADERVRLLNEIDFEWTTRSEGTWDQRIGELREFKLRHGHVMVPRTHAPNPQLSSWVATQRKNYNRKREGKTSPLTAGRIRELDDMGFVWCFWDYNFMASNERHLP